MNTVRLFFILLVGKTIIFISRFSGFGSGSTLPGHIILKLRPNFLSEITKESNLKIVLITGTNGKTTTSTIITTVLKENGKSAFQNTSGANLKSGIVSSFISHANLAAKINYEYAILEVDENNLSLILDDIVPHSILVLNLFRDQLDRYEELDSIVAKWNKAFQKITDQTTLILNADDPLVVSLSQGKNIHSVFFGLNDETMHEIHEHAADSIYCPRCQTKLVYSKIYYSHLGHWSCPACHFARPQPDLATMPYQLPGIYNKYNTVAACLFLKGESLSLNDIEQSLKKVKAAFGRQELLTYEGKQIQIFLSKNPTSFNQTLATILSLSPAKKCNLLVVLNDSAVDGRDISWIWDVDFEEYITHFKQITISGTRAEDLALRLRYAQEKYGVLPNTYDVEQNLEKAVANAVRKSENNEYLYIVPTYSAMLGVRKILTGKKIL